MNKNISRANSDEVENIGYSDKLGFTVRTNASHLYNVNITSDIVGPDYYTEVFALLLDAGPDDTVQFIVTSQGGRLDGLAMLLEGISITEAKTIAILVGNVYSAASLLAMAVDEVIALPSCDMLCHSMRYGTGGKSADIISTVEHNTKLADKLFSTYYEGFLSPDELSRVRDGKEMFMGADEIAERLEARQQYFIDKYAVKEENLESGRSGEVTPNIEVRPQERGSSRKKKQ